MAVSRREPANGWPSWTDEIRIELGPGYEPSLADREWLAREMGGEVHTDDALPDEIIGRLALEREAQDAIERGLLF